MIDVESPAYSELATYQPQSIVNSRGDDLAWLFYTSGTTGNPKGACLTHLNLLAMCDGYLHEIDTPCKDDKWLHAALMSHGGGLYALPNFLKGGTQTPGKIHVSGSVVMEGYWENPAATDETLMDGWLATGDIGVLDNEGFLTLKDRSKEVIISGDSNIYPRKTELVLDTLEGIEAVSVADAPHPEWSEVIIPFVVARHEADLAEDILDAHCLKSIARFKRPRRYIFLDGLPKNAAGKIDKRVLRNQLQTMDS